jgi:hypothetical protein
MRAKWRVTSLSLLFLGLVGGSWSLSSPIGSSPDDDFHLTNIWCGQFAPDATCQPAGEATYRAVPEILVRPDCFARNGATSARCLEQFSSTELAWGRFNNDLYPPGYYDIMSMWVTGTPEESVVLIRLFNWVLSLGLIALSFFVAKPDFGRPFLMGTLAVSIPMGVFLFASTNPSGLAIAAVSAFWCSGATFLKSEDRRQAIPAAGVMVLAALFAAGTRGDAALYVAIVGVALLIIDNTWRSSRLKILVIVAIALSMCLYGLSISQVQGSMSSGGLGMGSASSSGSQLWYNITNLPLLWMGNFGSWGLGWLDTTMPSLVRLLSVTVLASLLLVNPLRKSLQVWLALGLCSLFITAVPLYMLHSNQSIVGENVQARYLLPMIAVMISITLSNLRNGFMSSFSRGRIVVLTSLLSVSHAIALHTNIRRYVTGQDVLGFNLGPTDLVSLTKRTWSR